MPSWRRKESFPPRAAVVTSAKIGTAARLRRCSVAVHSTTRQPEAARRHRRRQYPSLSTRSGVLARPHEVVAHVGRRERLVPVQVEGGDQELGDRDLPEVLEQQAQLPRERTRVQDQVRGHRAGPEDLERGRPAHGGLLDRPESTSPERRREEEVRDARGAVGALLQPPAQLPKAPDELLRHPLVGEEVAPGGDLVHERLQRVGDHELGPVEEGLARGPGRLHPTGRGGRAGGKGQRSGENEDEEPATVGQRARRPGRG